MVKRLNHQKSQSRFAVGVGFELKDFNSRPKVLLSSQKGIFRLLVFSTGFAIEETEDLAGQMTCTKTCDQHF